MADDKRDMEGARTAWEHALIIMLVFPMLCAVVGALQRGRLSNKELVASQVTISRHLPRDKILLLKWLNRLKAAVQALAIWYFGSAFFLTSPLLYLRKRGNPFGEGGNYSSASAATSSTFSNFLETDCFLNT